MAELMLLGGGPVPPWASHHFESLQLSGGGAFASLHEDKNLTSTHVSVERSTIPPVLNATSVLLLLPCSHS